MAENVMTNVTNEFSKGYLCEVVSKVTNFLKNITGKNPKEYPDYINVAVDWWADAVMLPQFDSGCDDISNLLFIIKAKDFRTFSEEEIDIFKKTLAKQITKEMKRTHRCCLRVDYYPNQALSVAGKKIGINPKSGYPCKTTMQVYDNKVIVSAGYQAEWETLWTAE